MKSRIFFVLFTAFVLFSCRDNNLNNENTNLFFDNTQCQATINVQTFEYLSPGVWNPISNALVSFYYPNGTLMYEGNTDLNGNLMALLDCSQPTGNYRVEAKTYNGNYIWTFGWNHFYFSGSPEIFNVNIILRHVDGDE